MPRENAKMALTIKQMKSNPPGKVSDQRSFFTNKPQRAAVRFPFFMPNPYRLSFVTTMPCGRLGAKFEQKTREKFHTFSKRNTADTFDTGAGLRRHWPKDGEERAPIMTLWQKGKFAMDLKPDADWCEDS
jgi:hypothetical protein